jgi:asparagine synthase (glutamine-hydrolysing)
MCGICGTYGFGDEALLRRMCDTLVHRGPDDEGFYADELVGLGMRRLSIIDLAGGAQPIHNEDRTIWLVFNGEIYNFQELRTALEHRGHHFSTASDTETIVHAYEEWGDDGIQRLRGMFAFALWDARRKRLLLARDRVGIKPLYYRHAGNYLWFASEIKAILQGGCPRELDFFALHQYLSFAHVPAPNTIFRGIKKLLPGHLLICQDGHTELRPFWDLELRPAQSGAMTWSDAKAEVSRLLDECVRLHMVADVPLGAFLSGGIDSSAIVGLMARHSPHPVRTFSLGFEARAHRFSELPYARLVAQHFKTEHLELPVTADVVRLLPSVIRHFDEPFANDTALVMYQLSQEVRKHVTVVLAGTGGDEVFAGYNRYVGMRLAEFYARAPHFVRARLADATERMVAQHADGRHWGRWLHEFTRAGLMTAEDRYVSWLTYFDEEAKRSLYADTVHALTADMDATSGVRAYLRLPERPRDYHDVVFYTDIKTYLPNDQLEYNEKMSMAHSLELRVPFCDHTLVEFAAQLPLHMKAKGGRPKRLLKEAMRGFLPDAIIDRPKVGLHAPIGIWLRSDLQPLVAELLSRTTVERRGYFRYDAIERLIGLHNAGRHDFSWEIWMLLVFEVWHRMYLDSPTVGEQFELHIPHRAAVSPAV